jgi:hypothetical protein
MLQTVETFQCSVHTMNHPSSQIFMESYFFCLFFRFSLELLHSHERRYDFNDLFPKIVNPMMGTCHVTWEKFKWGEFKCYKCGHALYCHIKYEYGAMPHFYCLHCLKQYKHRNYLQIHMLKHHWYRSNL